MANLTLLAGLLAGMTSFLADLPAAANTVTTLVSSLAQMCAR